MHILAALLGKRLKTGVGQKGGMLEVQRAEGQLVKKDKCTYMNTDELCREAILHQRWISYRKKAATFATVISLALCQ